MMGLFKKKPEWIITSRIQGDSMVLYLEHCERVLYDGGYKVVAARTQGLDFIEFESWLGQANAELESERDLRILRAQQAKEVAKPFR